MKWIKKCEKGEKAESWEKKKINESWINEQNVILKKFFWKEIEKRKDKRDE